MRILTSCICHAIGRNVRLLDPRVLGFEPRHSKKLGKAELYVDSDGEEPEDPNNAVAAGRALAVAAVAAAVAAGPYRTVTDTTTLLQPVSTCAGARARAWTPVRAHALARLGADTRAPGSNECNELESGALGRAMMQNSTCKPSRALGRQPRRGSCSELLPRQSDVQRNNNIVRVVQHFTKHCN